MIKIRQILQAISSSRGVTEWLALPHRGQVLATFSRSCYLDLTGRIIAIVSSDLLNGPLNVVLNADGNGAFERISMGTTVESSENRIHIDNAALIDLTQATVWDPQLPRWTREDWAEVRTHLSSIASLLLSEAPDASFAHYLHDAKRVVPQAQRALSLLEDGFTTPSVNVLTRAAGELAGLGGGLTPSGDDVLVGALVSVAVYPEDRHHAFVPAILTAARGRTTRISEAYLDAAAQGEAGEAWHSLVRALPGGDCEAITSAVRRVMRFGETSGSDMLTGFVLALSALIS